MNGYQTSTPRTAFGIAAATLTAMTIGVAVVLPAKMDATGAASRSLPAVAATTPAFTEVSIIPARIDVQGVSLARIGPSDGARRNPRG